MINLMRINFAFLFVVLWSACCFANGKEQQLHVAPHESWVQPQSLPLFDSIPQDKISNGVYYLLADTQVRVPPQGKSIIYSHYADKIVNESGLKESSQINIVYDPSYQFLAFHSLTIHRDGKAINALPAIRYSVLQRETELENSLYDGRLTANIIVSDLRVGDVLEYSFSITGDNPIHAGAFYYQFYTQWPVTLRQLYFRLLWERSIAPYFRANNSTLTPQITKFANASEYIYQVSHTAPLQTNSETPAWYDPYGRVEISNVAQWADVAAWAQVLYGSAIESDAALDQLASDIQSKHPNKEDQIAAALDVVQSQVRYLGIETGVNSHKPSKAGDTWRRRYGDCKDKAVLFISLLKKMGITAYPALVNTVEKQEIILRLPAATAFDHVVTKVELDGTSYWLDPTRTHQASKLDDIDQSEYGYALVVAPGSTALSPMNPKRISAQLIEEVLDLTGKRDAPVTYRISTQYFGQQAENLRDKTAQTNVTEMTDKFLNFYKDYYPSIKSTAPLDYQDYPDEARFQIKETYSIPDPWQVDESNRQKKYFGVYPSIIETRIRKPDELDRNSPFELRYPESITEHITVQVGSDWGFQQGTLDEDNEFFHYSRETNFEQGQNILHFVHKYTAKKDHVPADKIDTYLTARKKVMDDLYYYIYQPSAGSTNVFHYEDHLTGLLGIVYGLLSIIALVNWYRDKERQAYNLNAIFFPVSMVKFIILSVATLGIYLCYWFWRNWVYIKRRDNSSILPFGRAFFFSFWYYPFYKALISSEQVKSHRYLPRSLLLGGVLAVLFFVANIAGNGTSDVVDVASIGLCILLVLPLVIQVNKIPQTDSNVYAYNSRFKWRGLLMVLLGLPIVLLYSGVVSGFLAADNVVKGEQLWSEHIKFMQRNGIVSENESVQLFYSSALFDITEDGNGFTAESVFSYWKDEGELSFHSASLADVKQVELVQQKADQSSDAVIKIYPEQGNSFVLYVTKTDHDDKKFYEQLKQNWLAERNKRGVMKTSPAAELQ